MEGHHDHKSHCSCALHDSGVGQTLQELEFERGLWQAASDGDRERVKRLLDSGNSVNARDSSGYTALHYACRSGHVKVCRLLISSGADLNCQTPGGATGMHRAAYCGHSDVVELLIKEGGDGDMIDSDGMTPLHKACERDRVRVAESLSVKFPNTCHIQDKRGRLPRDLVPDWTQQWEKVLKIEDT